MRTHDRLPATLAALLAVLGLLPAAAGCGAGSSSDSEVTVSRMRAYNAVVSGGAADIEVDDADLVAGGAPFLEPTAYRTLTDGDIAIEYTLPNVREDEDDADDGDDDGLVNFAYGRVFPEDGADYTAVVIGRGDLTDAADPRYPRMRLLLDGDEETAAPAAGRAAVRVIHAAPDGANVDFYVGDTLHAGNVGYNSYRQYQEVDVPSAGTAVRVSVAGTPVNVVAGGEGGDLFAGRRYTLIFVQGPGGTSSTTGPFRLRVLDDTAARGR